MRGLDLRSHDYCSRALPRRQQHLLHSSLKECFNNHNMKTATVLIYVVYLLFITYTSNIDKIKKIDIENCCRKQLEETKMSRIAIDTRAEIKDWCILSQVNK